MRAAYMLAATNRMHSNRGPRIAPSAPQQKMPPPIARPVRYG